MELELNYKLDERKMKYIIKNNVKCCNPKDSIQFTPYYRTKKITNLIIKNNLTPPTNTLKKTNLIYQFFCHEGDSELHDQTYIGLTTTTLSRLLTMHLSNGGPKQHTQNSHNINLTRESLVNNNKIFCTNNDPYRLSILEALYIRNLSPSINKQITSSHSTLTLFTS